jgi:hypothetical protein
MANHDKAGERVAKALALPGSWLKWIGAVLLMAGRVAAWT